MQQSAIPLKPLTGKLNNTNRRATVALTAENMNTGLDQQVSAHTVHLVWWTMCAFISLEWLMAVASFSRKICPATVQNVFRKGLRSMKDFKVLPRPLNSQDLNLIKHAWDRYGSVWVSDGMITQGNNIAISLYYSICNDSCKNVWTSIIYTVLGSTKM